MYYIGLDIIIYITHEINPLLYLYCKPNSDRASSFISEIFYIRITDRHGYVLPDRVTCSCCFQKSLLQSLLRVIWVFGNELHNLINFCSKTMNGQSKEKTGVEAPLDYLHTIQPPLGVVQWFLHFICCQGLKQKARRMNPLAALALHYLNPLFRFSQLCSLSSCVLSFFFLVAQDELNLGKIHLLLLW